MKKKNKDEEKEILSNLESGDDTDHDPDRYAGHTRRTFLQAGAGVLAGAALAACDDDIPKSSLPEPTEKQMALKRKGRSRVLVKEAPSYDAVGSILQEAWKEIGPPVKDKSVFLKLNLVDYREGIPCCTHYAVVAAIVDLLKDAGVKELKLGDGPALTRDTERIARMNGIEAVCKKAGIEFVDLNLDDLDEVENPLKFTHIDKFLLPRTVCKSDLVISVPKLKTHHWALMTCSMKNMFGVVPGRKYGWPKNILHVRGINQSILDIVSAVKPGFAIVDAIQAMEGDGPLNGKARDLNLLILGEDLVAVDTVGGLCMELPVHNIPYLKLAGKVLGNADIGQIDVLGAKIESVKKKFVLPPTYEPDGRPKDLRKLAKGAESGVT